MNEKTAYEKALDERFGEGFSDELRKTETCEKCGAKMIMCPRCGEFICSEGCE